jgi:hypothetical protein
MFRIEQIKSEGNDPVKTGQSFGTPHDIAALYKGNGGVPKGYDEREQPPKGGWPGAGRPEEPGTYGTHEHPLGWDPLGNKANRNVSEKNQLGKYKSVLEEFASKKQAIAKTILQEQNNTEDTHLLSETNILEED